MEILKYIKLHFFIHFLFFCSCSEEEVFYSPNQPDSIIDPSDQYLIVLGDVQEYTRNDYAMDYLNISTEWIVTQCKEYNNISSVIELGDVTNNNLIDQWQRYNDNIQGYLFPGKA